MLKGLIIKKTDGIGLMGHKISISLPVNIDRVRCVRTVFCHCCISHEDVWMYYFVSSRHIEIYQVYGMSP